MQVFKAKSIEMEKDMKIQENSGKSGSILYHTFGCKLNFAETATIQNRMEREGYVTFHPSGKDSGAGQPDIVFVNSCSVTEVADKKCRQFIRSANRRYPQASIVVTGCYAQLKGDEVSRLPGVRIVAGSDRKGEIPSLIRSLADSDSHIVLLTPVADIDTFTPSCSRGDRTRYFLKVQDGCDYRCSYCTIPKARGKSRSPEIESLVEQAETVAAEGGREIILTGVNIGDFGKGSANRFIDLIMALDEVKGIERYRISSIEPNLITDEIIEFCAASKRFMPHFHIPLQHGSDEVLALMRRRYKSELFARRIEKIRALIPDAFIGVDLIVGPRGETPELFHKSKLFVESLDISRLHVFAYSERPGTDALSIPYKVDAATQSARVHEMLEVSDNKLKDFSRRYLGTVRPVLIEHGRDMKDAAGFTDNYLRVRLDGESAVDNSIVNVRLDSLDDSGEFFHGTIVKDNSVTNE